MDLLATLSEHISGATPIAVLAAFAWGLASIWLSPCHLAGVPLVVGYLAGPCPTRARPWAILLTFALGVLLSLLPLGAGTLLLGRVAGDLGISSHYLVAALCLFAGLYLLDWLTLPWRGWGLPPLKTRGPGAALLLGLLFGLALGPCAFAWIAPLLAIAWLHAAEGLGFPALLLGAFAAGHCGGVLLAGESLHRVQGWLDRMARARGRSGGRALCGTLLLIVAGGLLVTA